MAATGSSTVELGRAESLALLGTAAVGRIVYTRHALPAIRVVRFVVDGDDIVVSVPEQLLRAVDGSVVAFEADRMDTAGHETWSVVVTGRAELCKNPSALDQAKASKTARLVSDDSPYLVHIQTEIVDGRQSRRPDL